MYQFYLPRFVFLLLLLSTGACVTSQDQGLFTGYPEEMTRFSLVSMSEPGFALSPGSSMSFHPQMLRHEENQDPAETETRALLNDVIRQSLSEKGFSFSPYVRAQGDIWLAYTVIYQHSMNDDQITQQFGMSPGFPDSGDTQYEKGTLILDLIDAKRQKTVWRSSVQGLVAEELEEKLRRIRLRAAFDQMFDGLPVQGN